MVRESRKGLWGRFASGHRGGCRRFTCRSPTTGASGLEATPVFFHAGARMYDLPIVLFDVLVNVYVHARLNSCFKGIQ
jgi:hypothetical protein